MHCITHREQVITRARGAVEKKYLRLNIKSSRNLVKNCVGEVRITADRTKDRCITVTPSHVSRNYSWCRSWQAPRFGLNSPIGFYQLMPSIRNQIIHNAKGRAASGGKRKKGKINKKHKSTTEDGEDTGMETMTTGGGNVLDSNATILEHKSKEEKEAERKEKMLREVCNDSAEASAVLTSCSRCKSTQRPNGRIRRKKGWRNISLVQVTSARNVAYIPSYYRRRS